jgi:hypothetical protein
MTGAQSARQQNSYSISRRAEAGLTVLDMQCVSTREYAGKNSEKAMEEQQIIDRLELALERMRDLDPALKTAMIADLDRLRELTK